MRFVLAIICLTVPAFADGLCAQQMDPKYLLVPLQTQRNQAWDTAAICGATNAQLQEEIAALKAKLAEMETKSKPSEKNVPGPPGG